METQEKRPVPPYLSFTTLTNFIEGLGENMPTRIDRSLMKSMSGASQSALVSALDYFRLRDGEKPTETLSTLAVAEGLERAKIWKDLIHKGYPFLFQDGFNLKRATQGELDERFREAGVSGATVRKCVSFFMAAARVAGIEVSPHFKTIKSRAPRSPRASSGRTRRIRREEKQQEQTRTQDFDSGSYIAASVTFEGGVIAELRVTGNAFALGPTDRTELFKWIDNMKAHKTNNGSADSDSATPAS